MHYDEPHLAPNEKMHPFQWTERPIGALVVISSLLPAKNVASGTWFGKFQHDKHKKPNQLCVFLHMINLGGFIHFYVRPTHISWH
jgi:hypothetical protein